MKIAVGSKNPAKIQAVKELILDYKMLAAAEIVGVEVSSNVSDQPMSLEETMQGAMNRAQASLPNHDYGIGIEGGLISVNYEGRDRFFNICFCAIYDGENYYLGAASLFELPEKVATKIREGENLSDSMHLSGLTDEKQIGKTQGAIGLLTKGRLPRKAYSQQALRNALIHLENREIYEISKS